jgi:hypothetical protein
LLYKTIKKQLTSWSVRSHWDHPYNNVRHQIANTLATLLGMDIPIMGAPVAEHSAGEHSAGVHSAKEPSWNVGRGFPTIKAVFMFRNNLFIKQISLLDL